jgi:hypothetical protein
MRRSTASTSRGANLSAAINVLADPPTTRSRTGCSKMPSMPCLDEQRLAPTEDIEMNAPPPSPRRCGSAAFAPRTLAEQVDVQDAG